MPVDKHEYLRPSRIITWYSCTRAAPVRRAESGHCRRCRQANIKRLMANPSAPDYKALLGEALKQLRRAKEERQHEAALRTQAEELARNTTFDEYVSACHSLLSVPLRVAHPSRSTKSSIPAPRGKYCPTRLREWTDFPAQQADVYNTVRRYLQPVNASTLRLFFSLIALEGLG